MSKDQPTNPRKTEKPLLQGLPTYRGYPMVNGITEKEIDLLYSKLQSPTQEPTGAVPTPKWCPACRGTGYQHRPRCLEDNPDPFKCEGCGKPSIARFCSDCKKLTKALPTDKKLPSQPMRSVANVKFEDSPILNAKRRAFDKPTIENLDHLINVVEACYPTKSTSKSDDKTCRVCGGAGVVGFRSVNASESCNACHGTGLTKK